MENQHSMPVAVTGVSANENVVSGPQQVPSVSTEAKLSMELLLASPYFWKSEKICRFFTAAHTYAWERPNVKDFKKALNKDVPDFQFWGFKDEKPINQWKDVLSEDYQIITSNHTNKTQQNNAKSGKTSTKVDLLRRIRDNFIHHQKIYVEHKRTLGWFHEKPADATMTSANSSNISPTFELDQRLFVHYWIERFPNLFPYLWLHFQAFEDASLLKEFYPVNVPKYSDDLFKKLVNFSAHLNGQDGALMTELNKGRVITRYSLGSSPNDTTIEFRTLRRNILHKLLHMSSLAEIEFHRDQVFCKWYDEKRDEFSVDSRITKSGSTNSDRNVFFLVDNIQYIGENRVQEYLEALSREGVKSTMVIYINENQNDFAHRESIKQFVEHIAKSAGKKLVHLPVKFTELNNNIQLEITEQGKFSIHNRVIPLIKMLPDDNEARKEILSHLEGDVLNQLLRHESPELLTKLEQPFVSAPYFTRKISKRVEVNADMLKQKDSQNYVFVFANISADVLENILRNNGRSMKKIEMNSQEIFKNVGDGLFWTEHDIHDDNLHLEKFLLETFPNKKIHCLRYLHGEKFELLATNSDDSSLEIFLGKKVSKIRELLETSFLKSLIDSLDKIVFLADEPGMGKTTVFISLANELESANSQCIAFVINMTAFTKTFIECHKSSANDLQQFRNALLELLCTSEFERRLLEYWLSGENCSKTSDNIKLEIMLDGLDEVEVKYREHAIQILDIFYKNSDQFLSVRLWVSFRDHMLKEIDAKFNTLGFKMKSFNESEQTNFLIEYWKQKNPKINVNFDSDKIISFAKSCLKLPLSQGDKLIASTPLVCRMIAEIYEDCDFAGNLEPILYDHNFSLTDLYSDLMDKKLERSLREKDRFTAITKEMSTFKEMRAHMNSTHAYYAIKLILTDKLADKFKDRLCVTSVSKKDFEFSVLRPGAIDNLDPLRFKHRTFAEYFLALFVYNVLANQSPIKADDVDFEKIMESLFEQDGDNIRNIKVKHPIVCAILNSMARKWSREHVIKGCRGTLIDDGKWELELNKTVLKYLESTENECLCKLVRLKKYHFEVALLVSSSNCKRYKFQLLVYALLSGDYRFCLYVLVNKLMSFNDLKELTSYNTKYGYGFFRLFCLGLTSAESNEDIHAAISVLTFLRDTCYISLCSDLVDMKQECDILRFLLERFNCISWRYENIELAVTLVDIFVHDFNANVAEDDYTKEKIFEYFNRKCEDENCHCKLTTNEFTQTMSKNIFGIIEGKRNKTISLLTQ